MDIVFIVLSWLWNKAWGERDYIALGAILGAAAAMLAVGALILSIGAPTFEVIVISVILGIIPGAIVGAFLGLVAQAARWVFLTLTKRQNDAREQSPAAQLAASRSPPTVLSMQTLHEYPLTPSEILLIGEEFWSDLSKSLERRMLAAAFIANEKAGAIRLEVHDRRFLFGLRTVTELLVVPRHRAVEWPSPSLEASIVRIAERPSYLEGYTVSKIVSEWMSGDGNSASRNVKEQLVTRGLLEKIEERDFFCAPFWARFGLLNSTINS